MEDPPLRQIDRGRHVAAPSRAATTFGHPFPQPKDSALALALPTPRTDSIERISKPSKSLASFQGGGRFAA